MSTQSVAPTSNLQKYGLLVPQLLWPFVSAASSAVIAYRIRDWSLKSRWVIGFGMLKMYQETTNYSNRGWKESLPSFLTMNNGTQTLLWLTINGAFAMLWGAGFSGFFGGKSYYIAHGIDSYRKAFVSGLCPGHVYFKKNPDGRRKALKSLLKTVGFLSAAYGIGKVLKSGLVSQKYIESNFVLHMEVLGLFLSCLACGVNSAANLHYLIFGGNDDMEVIPPYDFVYLSKSIRVFWYVFSTKCVLWRHCHAL